MHQGPIPIGFIALYFLCPSVSVSFVSRFIACKEFKKNPLRQSWQFSMLENSMKSSEQQKRNFWAIKLFSVYDLMFASWKWLHSFVPEICKCYLTEFVFTVIVLAAAARLRGSKAWKISFWKHVFLMWKWVSMWAAMTQCVCVWYVLYWWHANLWLLLPGNTLPQFCSHFTFLQTFCLFLCVSIFSPFIVVSGMLRNVEMIINQYHCCFIGITCLSWPFLSF